MKKQALIFIEDGSFTYDNRVIREANALVEGGWDVTVISPKYPDDPFYKLLHEKLRAYYYPKPTAKGAIGHIVEHSISLLLGSILTLWVAVRHGFTVFHASNPMDILWLIALPYRMIGKKFIFDQHDLCPELFLSREDGGECSLFYKALMLLERYSYRCADAVIATNESYKQVAIERGGKRPDEVFVVRNGPDLNKFKQVLPQKDLKNDDEILVGYLGNMNLQDGVDYLLTTVEEIVKNRHIHNVKFVFIGGGSHQPYLSNLAVEMGLKEFVTFTGRVSDDAMLAILCACDICVQPDPFNALNDKSTMNKVMEYMALEKPVVAFDLKETRVSCGDAALYATPNNIVELADRIICLAENSEYRNQMGKIGRERIEQLLSWNYSVPQLLAAYDYVTSK